MEGEQAWRSTSRSCKCTWKQCMGSGLASHGAHSLQVIQCYFLCLAGLSRSFLVYVAAQSLIGLTCGGMCMMFTVEAMTIPLSSGAETALLRVYMTIGMIMHIHKVRILIVEKQLIMCPVTLAWTKVFVQGFFSWCLVGSCASLHRFWKSL